VCIFFSKNSPKKFHGADDARPKMVASSPRLEFPLAVKNLKFKDFLNNIHPRFKACQAPVWFRNFFCHLFVGELMITCANLWMITRGFILMQVVVGFCQGRLWR